VRNADMLVASSAALLEAMRELGAAPERLTQLNWGVDLEAFAPPRQGRQADRAALGLPSGAIVLAPRSLGDVYNPRVFLRAFDRLADEREDATLVLLQARSDHPALTVLRHRERARIVGRVSYEQMAAYYRAADVCVSVASSDSSPRSVWEAMACGLPCVLSDIPWVPELIANEKHALVVPIDEVAVAEAVGRLLDDRLLAARISDAGRRLVERHRDRAREMDRLCEIYEQVAREGGRRSRAARALGPAAAAAGTAQALVRRSAGKFLRARRATAR
jgi:glycosyltransferase involved in cell wall biosynthesis